MDRRLVHLSRPLVFRERVSRARALVHDIVATPDRGYRHRDDLAGHRRVRAQVVSPHKGGPMIDKPQSARPIAPQLVMGVLIVVVGLLFTLENVGVIDGHDYLRYWPVALIAVGLLTLW